jgi:hypothetical protein
MDSLGLDENDTLVIIEHKLSSQEAGIDRMGDISPRSLHSSRGRG